MALNIKIRESSCPFCNEHEVTLTEPSEVCGEITLIRDGDGVEVYEAGRYTGYSDWKFCPYCGTML